ncbi:HK97 gp10 family phage protein [Actinocrispum wychmicini]|uniref:Bacteriophage HK97-gp10 putative tail-component n=1 Tax=Actinocrispum wychmicini TaxID=1213861 RepID=A0A4R2KEJ4_9PSEU|nr:HK97 gp10 family phage protein [Actinocrispum wychmicini]TCO64955.1 bacteriophage HK97-gp10 putative tail-component [Actinocrispum wychmicini]
MITEPIKIDGLAQFSRNLRKLDNDLPKALRLAANAAADVVVADTVSAVPRRTGRAQSSVKARSTRTEARVQAGGTKAPYFAWLDWGGKVGRKHHTARPWIKTGRYLYPAYTKNRDKVREIFVQALLQVAEQAGIEVD